MPDLPYPARPAPFLSGAEPLHHGGIPMGSTVLDFWQWASSDLLSNAARGTLAEFLVAAALGLGRTTRVEWDAFDLVTPEGLRIEVKSAATWQSWAQARPSTLTFGIAPTNGWDASTNTYSADRRRQAHLYVFCVLDHPDKAQVDPLDAAQWTFYVVPTARLDEHCGPQKTIRLSRLVALGVVPVSFDRLRAQVAAEAEELGAG